MFTDKPTLPLHLETLLDVLKEFSDAKLSKKEIGSLLHPPGIFDTKANINFTNSTINAAASLDLIKEAENIISINFDSNQTSKNLILDALDLHVFSNEILEPSFAPFYSFFLSKEDIEVPSKGLNDWWLGKYHEHENFGGRRPETSALNYTKLNALYRWYMYAGLGWRDPSETFQAYPYTRIKRVLKKIFKNNQKLNSREFRKNLGIACPELDGGKIFEKYKSKTMNANNFTLGVSQALISLNEDQFIKLVCPVDSDGLSIEKAKPTIKGEVRSNRITMVEFIS